MAAISLKNSDFLNKRPPANDLIEGEVAINYHESDPGAFFKGNSGNLIKLGPTYIGDDPPNFLGAGVGGGEAGFTRGELWWDSTSGILYIYYTTGTENQWVPITGGF